MTAATRCPNCVCPTCDALVDAGFRAAPIEPTILVTLWAEVDRATRESRGKRAAEAVGDFFRRGQPGPTRFPVPVAEAVGRFLRAGAEL